MCQYLVPISKSEIDRFCRTSLCCRNAVLVHWIWIKLFQFLAQRGDIKGQEITYLSQRSMFIAIDAILFFVFGRDTRSRNEIGHEHYKLG